MADRMAALYARRSMRRRGAARVGAGGRRGGGAEEPWLRMHKRADLLNQIKRRNQMDDLRKESIRSEMAAGEEQGQLAREAMAERIRAAMAGEALRERGISLGEEQLDLGRDRFSYESGAGAAARERMHGAGLAGQKYATDVGATTARYGQILEHNRSIDEKIAQLRAFAADENQDFNARQSAVREISNLEGQRMPLPGGGGGVGGGGTDRGTYPGGGGSVRPLPLVEKPYQDTAEIEKVFTENPKELGKALQAGPREFRRWIRSKMPNATEDQIKATIRELVKPRRGVAGSPRDNRFTADVGETFKDLDKDKPSWFSQLKPGDREYVEWPKTKAERLAEAMISQLPGERDTRRKLKKQEGMIEKASALRDRMAKALEQSRKWRPPEEPQVPDIPAAAGTMRGVAPVAPLSLGEPGPAPEGPQVGEGLPVAGGLDAVRRAGTNEIVPPPEFMDSLTTADRDRLALQMNRWDTNAGMVVPPPAAQGGDWWDHPSLQSWQRAQLADVDDETRLKLLRHWGVLDPAR
jgi:hypothetical protein